VNDDSEILAAIRLAPHDMALRRAYADWLAWRNDPRGEFLHLQQRVKELCYRTPEYKQAHDRKELLGRGFSRDWLLLVGEFVLGTVEMILRDGMQIRLDRQRGWLSISQLPNPPQCPGHEINWCHVGDALDVRLMKIDATSGRLDLTIRQVQEISWWPCALQFYPVGTEVLGTVEYVGSYGLLIELEEYVVGLLRLGELTHPLDRVRELFHRGDRLSVVVTRLDEDRHCVFLGLAERSETLRAEPDSSIG
jgi:uncharacterized protein (TIGR02996 family)